MKRFLLLLTFVSALFVLGCSSKIELTSRFSPENFKKIPTTSAVITKIGEGTRKLIVVSRINCPYCRQLHFELAKLENVTIYSFVFSGGTKHTQQLVNDIYCSERPYETLSQVFNNPDEYETKNNYGCAAIPLVSNAEQFFAEQKVLSYPALINQYGDVSYGARSAAEIDHFIGQ